MLEITEPARRLLQQARRARRVLAIHAPWSGQGYQSAGLVTRWLDADDPTLGGYVRVGDGDWIYVPADLLPTVRTRRLRLDLHSILGLWPGISVRELDPVPLFAVDRSGLWPRIRRRD